VPASYRLADRTRDIDPCCGCFLQHLARLAQKALALLYREPLGRNHDDWYFAPLLARGKGVQEMLLEHRVGGLPVLDVSGRIVGIFSESDLLREEGNAEDRSPWLEIIVGPDGPAALLVGISNFPNGR
jgi:hypothetical protein